MNLANRLERVEQAQFRRLAEQAGMTAAEAEETLVLWARAERECPSVPAGDGLVNVEPTVRRVAALLGVDGEVMIGAYLAAAQGLGVRVQYVPGPSVGRG